MLDSTCLQPAMARRSIPSILGDTILGDTVSGGGVIAVEQNNGQIENYEDLLEDYSHFAPPAADEVLQGTVLSITGQDVIIDFGYKSEGIVPIEEFQTPSGEITVQRGDAVDVMIDHGE